MFVFVFLYHLCCTVKALCDFINTFDQTSQKHSEGGRLVCGIRNTRAGEEEKEREDGVNECQRITRLPLVSKYSKERQRRRTAQTTHTHTHTHTLTYAHSDHSIFRGTISQALITAGCGVSYLVFTEISNRTRSHMSLTDPDETVIAHILN